MNHQNQLPTLPLTLLTDVTGGAARLNARVTTQNQQITQALTDVTNQVKDLANTQNQSSSSSMMPMVMMMMMKNKG